jgi:uncharacterized protein YcfL
MKKFFLLLVILLLTGCVSHGKMVAMVRGTQDPLEFEVQYTIGE